MKVAGRSIQLEQGDLVQVSVPASMGQTCVYLEVNPDGKLVISSGTSAAAIESVGEGIASKVRKKGGW